MKSTKRKLLPLFIGTCIMMSCADGKNSKTAESESVVAAETVKSEVEERPRVAVLIADGFQDAEAIMPIGYLSNHGAKIVTIGSKTGNVKAENSDFEMEVEKAVPDIKVEDFDVLVIPGGKAPAKLREDENVLEFVKSFNDAGKPIAAICHGPQVLAKAGILKGLNATAVTSIQDEVKAAGANYQNQALVKDKNIITSRVPEDLPVFSKAILEVL